MYPSSHHIHKTTSTDTSHFIQARICHTAYKHGYVTLHTNPECHASQRPNLPQFIATQPAIRDACFQNLINRPKIRRLHLPQDHIHTGHHKLCRPLCILTRKNQFASKKRLSYLSAKFPFQPQQVADSSSPEQ